MKPLLLLASLLFSAQTFARIGETTDQLQKRFGRPVATVHEEGDTRLYSFRGFTILVGLEQGLSLCEIYQKADRSRMNDSDVRGLLDANAGRSPWRDQPEENMENYVYWSQDKKSRVAIYHLASHKLLITSKPYLARFVHLLGSSSRKGLEGF